MAFLIIDFSEFLVFSSVIFFIHEQIFLVVLNRGWSHTIYRYRISSCICSDTGSGRDNETNVDSWRIEFRAFRPARDI